jgi:hypothetical protein
MNNARDDNNTDYQINNANSSETNIPITEERIQIQYKKTK